MKDASQPTRVERLTLAWLVGEVAFGLLIATPALMVMAGIALFPELLAVETLAALFPRRTWFPLAVAGALVAGFFAVIALAVRREARR